MPSVGDIHEAWSEFLEVMGSEERERDWAVFVVVVVAVTAMLGSRSASWTKMQKKA